MAGRQRYAASGYYAVSGTSPRHEHSEDWLSRMPGPIERLQKARRTGGPFCQGEPTWKAGCILSQSRWPYGAFSSCCIGSRRDAFTKHCNDSHARALIRPSRVSVAYVGQRRRRPSSAPAIRRPPTARPSISEHLRQRAAVAALKERECVRIISRRIADGELKSARVRVDRPIPRLLQRPTATFELGPENSGPRLLQPAASRSGLNPAGNPLK